MLINDTTKDVKKLLVETGHTQAAIADKVGISRQYANMVIQRNHVEIVNDWFVKILEEMGYDIEIRYVKMSMKNDN